MVDQYFRPKHEDNSLTKREDLEQLTHKIVQTIED